jgi:CheY-like chemotaxis protein
MLREGFGVEILRADQWIDAAAALQSNDVDLVLVNRKLDIDYSDGLEIIRRMKSDPALRSIPVMLITNYPEYQEAAVALGAEYGFGKLELRTEQTKARLTKCLCPESQEVEHEA